MGASLVSVWRERKTGMLERAEGCRDGKGSDKMSGNTDVLLDRVDYRNCEITLGQCCRMTNSILDSTTI